MSNSAHEGDGQTSDGMTKHLTGNALGAGLALVVLPSIALFLGLDQFSKHTIEGLPVIAIFGIMILFGSLALVATLFKRLDLANENQALALPEGSIRATIALALIVLFAIISIMLYRSSSEPYMAKGLTMGERKALIENGANRVILVMEEACASTVTTAATPPASAASDAKGGQAAQASASDASAGLATSACPEKDQRFTIALRAPASPEASDLAKQLLILVGTLMTSVTSFYFASRGTEAATSAANKAQNKKDGATEGTDGQTNSQTQQTLEKTSEASDDHDHDHADHPDGCDVAIEDHTGDEDLPPASGGVGK